MTLDPFVAGILATLFVEMAIITVFVIIAILVSMRNK